MADDFIYVEHVAAMRNLTKSWTGPVGQHIKRKTTDTAFHARIYAPKPGGVGHGRTKINFATGELAGGIITNQTRSQTGELEGHVIAVPKHALFVHNGTKPHVIKAKRAPYLVFFWHRVGRVVSFKSVNHPGTPADPFLAKGLDKVFRRQ